jgi:hypothetical protein
MPVLAKKTFHLPVIASASKKDYLQKTNRGRIFDYKIFI